MNSLKKPLSESRLRANRANAQLSTGPRTPEGKLRSSCNALKHGLTARDLTALGEHYDSLPETIAAFRLSWQPRTPYESTLVDQLAVLKVRLDRCTRMETGILDNGIPSISAETSPESVNSAIGDAFSHNTASLTLLSRYETQISRAYDRTFKELQSLQKDRPHPLSQPCLEPSSPNNDFCETNPNPVENKPSASPNEPASVVPIDRRLELEYPPAPSDLLSRRHGHPKPLPKPIHHPIELVWVPAEE